jgi:putative endonuclease
MSGTVFLASQSVEGIVSGFFVYMLKCRDGTLYTGWTTDLSKRLAAHNKGTASKYTRPRRPVFVVYSEEWNTKQEAMRREYEIKTWTREKKDRLLGSLPLHLSKEFHSNGVAKTPQSER